MLDIPRESGRYVCSVCKGGSTGERSLVVKRAGSTVKYICHRDSCTLGAGSFHLSGRPDFSEAPVKPVPKHHPVYPAPTPTKYSYFHNPIDTACSGSRHAFRVLDARGNLDGHVLRAVNKHIKPKVLNQHTGIGLHFPLPVKSSSIVVVEDIPSAEKTCHVVPCCAILGTYLSPEKVAYLHSVGIRKIYIALDADATRKAVLTRRAYAVPSEIIVLPKDLKDCSFEEIETLTKRVTNDPQ